MLMTGCPAGRYDGVRANSVAAGHRARVNSATLVAGGPLRGEKTRSKEAASE
jgi:hypothetical protein